MHLIVFFQLWLFSFGIFFFFIIMEFFEKLTKDYILPLNVLDVILAIQREIWSKKKKTAYPHLKN